MLQQALRETIRVQGGRIPLLPRHLARLEAGGCDSSVLEAVRARALEAAAGWPQAYGRMTLVVDTDATVTCEIADRPSTIQVPGGPSVALVESETPVLPPGAAKPADRAFWDEALHAAQLSFIHPQSGERVVFSAPLPEDLENLRALFREAAPGYAGKSGLQAWQDKLKG